MNVSAASHTPDFLDILLIEDSPADALLIERAFSKNTYFSYNLRRATTIAEAARLLGERPYSVVLLDYSLPDSVGFDGLSRIRDIVPNVPVIMVTAYADEDAALESMERGAQDWLSKSIVTPQSLLRATRYAIQRQYLENMKSEFISIVSHELRTPITSMRGSLGLVLGTMSVELPENVKKLLAIANDNCERLVSIVNDILDIDKLAANGMRLALSSQPVGDLLRRAVSLNEAAAHKSDVRIKASEIRSDLYVLVDPDRFQQIMSNLLSNAIKFSPASSEIDITVIDRADKEGGDKPMMRIQVRDHGQGIPEDFRANIFEKFAQAEPTWTRAKGGTGLGLHIVKTIVARMNGKVGFDSELGKGSTFWVEFPRVSATHN